MSMTDYVLYSDGACSGNPGPGGFAWDLYRGNVCDASRIASGEGGAAQATNQVMELLGLLDGLEALVKCPAGHVLLRLDSEYALKGLLEWMPGWKRDNWTKSSGKTIANLEIWKRLDLAKSALYQRGFVLKNAWIRGHSGEPWNERVDRRACLMRDQAARVNRRECSIGDQIAGALPAAKSQTNPAPSVPVSPPESAISGSGLSHYDLVEGLMAQIDSYVIGQVSRDGIELALYRALAHQHKKVREDMAPAPSFDA